MSSDEDQEDRRPFDLVRWGFRLIAMAVALVVTAITVGPYVLAKLYNERNAQEAEAEAKAHPPFIQAYVVSPDAETSNPTPNPSLSAPASPRP